ncbi:hypothetical protein [Roseibium sp. TrichSKD4]|uniref:hypothetical protein n=1 Tax=Roseibium sp. TrichSKD4 TaxID=744980 RepID=UPI001AD929BD|nr:hypothetical protein [Roseibium sp. TrichSKD4]
METNFDRVEWVNPMLFSRAFSGLEREITKLGYVFRLGSDFEELEKMLSDTDKGELTEHFNTVFNTYTPESGFWAAVLDADGACICIAAARVDNLGKQSLQTHLRKYWKRCYPAICDGRALASNDQPRFQSQISGRVAYLGDLWVRQQCRGKRIHERVAPLIMLAALHKWEPDWMYCWVRPSAWSKRYPLAYGFSTVEPVGIRWENPPSSIDDDLVLARNSYSQCLDWLDHFAAKFPAA